MKIGDRVRIKEHTHTRAGEEGMIDNTDYADIGMVVVRFDDGKRLAYLLDDDELEIVQCSSTPTPAPLPPSKQD